MSSSLNITMETKRGLAVENLPVLLSNVRGCKEDAASSSQACPLLSLPHRKGNKKPTRFREVPDHLVKLPKQGHRYLSKTGRPLWDSRYSFPPRQIRKKKKKRAPQSPSSTSSSSAKGDEPVEPSGTAETPTKIRIVCKPRTERVSKPRIKIKLIHGKDPKRSFANCA